MSAEYQNPHDDPDYQKFVEECARICHCCEECGHEVPCAGVLAGGPCDQACTCDEDRFREELNRANDYDDNDCALPIKP